MKSYGPIVEFECLNDCQQAGCPGHKVPAGDCAHLTRTHERSTIKAYGGHVPG
jgi:hypothetical protein